MQQYRFLQADRGGEGRGNEKGTFRYQRAGHGDAQLQFVESSEGWES
jgi:hypothetical protein